MAAQGRESVPVDDVDEIAAEQSSEWSVSNTRMLIEFYKSNRMLWDKSHKDNGNKTNSSCGEVPEGKSTENRERQ